MKQTNDYVFFWGGPFSQWMTAEMEIDGVQYGTAEQYMMAEKARLFGDTESEQKILSTSDPKVQKAIGRQVKGFDKAIWEEPLTWKSPGADQVEQVRPRCWQIVYKASYAKFTQNPGLLEELFATGTRLLVEASPYDVIWGIGLSEDAAGLEERTNWRGTNWLGEILTELREDLQLGLPCPTIG